MIFCCCFLKETHLHSTSFKAECGLGTIFLFLHIAEKLFKWLDDAPREVYTFVPLNNTFLCKTSSVESSSPQVVSARGLVLQTYRRWKILKVDPAR
jgi:hypothetical protein